MNVIALTDLHGRKNILTALAPELESADLLLLCGDNTHFGKQKEMEEIVNGLRGKISAIYAVTGNCDYPEAEKYLTREGISLNATVKKHAGYTLVGLSGSLPCPGKTPNEYSEEEYEAILGALSIPAGEPLLMVSHQPPFNTLNDAVSPGFHVGSKSIRKFIEKYQPLVCFTGHIHEGRAVDRIGDTLVVNPGPSGAGNFTSALLEENEVKNIRLRNLFNPDAI
ncbi:MAG: metallophosphoesterase family protein [Bacteroidales bacterium]|nr:metallophosphoesterase family protein [Bacteroidales bacterium]